MDSKEQDYRMLPEYVQIDDVSSKNRDVLRTHAEEIQFPLSDEDKAIVDQLVFKFSNEQNCAGLAAPQIGYGKRIVVFHVSEDAKSLRKDVYETVPPIVLVNPQYHPVGSDKTIDWEGCFSVKLTMGEVPRYTTIAYQGYDTSGNKVEGIAKGFLARLIQHEVGHLNGELFIDLITKGCRSGPVEEMRAVRIKEREASIAKP